MKRFWTITYVFTALAALTQAATITYYSTAADFLASSVVQSNPLITENFDHNTADFTKFELVGGSNGRRERADFWDRPNSQHGVFRGFVDGHFQDQVDLLPLQTTTISLINGNKMWGLGADFDLTPWGPGSHLAFLLHFEDGPLQLLTAVLGQNTGNYNGPFFFGFTSDKAFKAVTIGAAGIFSHETYTLDNLLISDPPAVSPTPEPATFALMGAALLGVGLFGRRIKVGKQ